MYAGVDQATVLVDDARTKLINVAANMNMHPFILSTLTGDQIYIAKRGEFQCMKASFNNGVLTPVYIGLLNDEGLFMIGSNYVEEDDVFMVLGSSYLWDVFTPNEIITLISQQKRQANEFNCTKIS